MKEGMNEVEVALEMMKIIAQAELGTVTENKKYFFGLYSECFSTIRAAQNAHGGAF